MLSDRSIREYIRRGLLKIEPLGHIGPASIDLHIGDELYRSDVQAHIRHYQEVAALARPETFHAMRKKNEEPHKLPFDQYVARFGKKLDDVDGCWILEPGTQYYAQTAETITTRGVRIWIATRSSAARNGLRVQFSDDKLDHGEEFEGRPFLVVGTYGTYIELPRNYSLCQVVVEPSGNLLYEEIMEAMRNGDITISRNPLIDSYSGSIILTLHPRLLRYNGRLMNPTKDSTSCFEEVDITKGYFLEPDRFYLGSTQEKVGIGRKHVGFLGEAYGSYYAHLNAAYHWPGSNNHITLEIFSKEPRFVKAGDFACRLFVKKLDSESDSPYNSGYNGQTGPTVSRGNLT